MYDVVVASACASDDAMFVRRCVTDFVSLILLAELQKLHACSLNILLEICRSDFQLDFVVASHTPAKSQNITTFRTAQTTQSEHIISPKWGYSERQCCTVVQHSSGVQHMCTVDSLVNP